MSVAQNIAGQLHHTKPDGLTPRKDVGMEVITDGVRVHIFPWGTVADIVYLDGPDLYSVKVTDEFGTSEYDRVDCITMTELVWGDEAKPYTDPVIVIETYNEDGTVATREEF